MIVKNQGNLPTISKAKKKAPTTNTLGRGKLKSSTVSYRENTGRES